MARSIEKRSKESTIDLGLFIIFFAIVMVFGGSARADAMSQPILRIASILLMVVCAWRMDAGAFQRAKWPLFFLVACAAVVALQLIPLPYGLWSALPGRTLYREALEIAGVAQAWRPLSLTPDLTVNALLAFLPVFATVMSLSLVRRADYPLLVPLLIVGIALSAVLGALQVAAHDLYFYRFTNTGSAVGFFANRNHQAVLLATAFPLLAFWAGLPHQDQGYRRLRAWLAICAAAALLPTLLITGSRAGLALGVLGIVAGMAFILRGRRHMRLGSILAPGRGKLVLIVPVLVGIAAVGGALALSKAQAYQRIIDTDDPGLRGANLPIYRTMIGDFLPVGSGFGSFDPVFRAYEPRERLDSVYLNHAHNDLVEILVEGGVLPLLLLLLFLAWFMHRSWQLWRHDLGAKGDLLARAATAVAVLLMLSSLVDYPLRTPYLAIVMAMACMFMIDRNRPSLPQENGRMS